MIIFYSIVMDIPWLPINISITLNIIKLLDNVNIFVKKSIHCIRMERLKKFVKAISRPTRFNLAPVRVKDVFRLQDIEQVFEK